MAFYFLGWLIGSGIQFQDSGPRWLIFLTNWAIVGFVIYLFLAALSVTTKFFTVHACKKSDCKHSSDRTTDYQFKKPQGCCGYGSNQLSWYQMIHWASFSICAEMALVVTILYWALLYGGWPVDGIDANTHLVNGIVSVLDVLVLGVPISLLHVIYPMSFAGVYAGFTGIYWAANGTNPSTGGRYIYPLIDYSSSPIFASIIVILVVILFVPVIHLVYYALYLARFWLVYAIFGRSKVSCWGEVLEEAGDKEKAVEMEKLNV